MEQKYAEYAAQKAVELLAIDSPTGFTDRAAAWVQDAFGALGFAAKKTAKGGVLIDLGGAESEEGALLLQAHTDTLGAMVAEVKANGRLRVTNLGVCARKTARRRTSASTRAAARSMKERCSCATHLST